MLKLILITSILLALAVIMLGIKVLFVKGAQFPLGHHHAQAHKTDEP